MSNPMNDRFNWSIRGKADRWIAVYTPTGLELFARNKAALMSKINSAVIESGGLS